MFHFFFTLSSFLPSCLLSFLSSCLPFCPVTFYLFFISVCDFYTLHWQHSFKFKLIPFIHPFVFIHSVHSIHSFIHLFIHSLFEIVYLIFSTLNAHELGKINGSIEFIWQDFLGQKVKLDVTINWLDFKWYCVAGGGGGLMWAPPPPPPPRLEFFVYAITQVLLNGMSSNLVRRSSWMWKLTD